MRTISDAVRSIETNLGDGVLDGYTFLLRRVLRGDAAALDALGSMFTYGIGSDPNLRLAIACYSVASQASYLSATTNLASALIEGAGVPKNVKKGVMLLRAASRAGEPGATNYLGFCYRNGEGVKKDSRRGFTLSLEAARLGVAAAQYDVGMCLLTGTGVSKDPVDAQRWLSRAARGGDRDAQEYVQRQEKPGKQAPSSSSGRRTESQLRGTLRKRAK